MCVELLSEPKPLRQTLGASGLRPGCRVTVTVVDDACRTPAALLPALPALERGEVSGDCPARPPGCAGWTPAPAWPPPGAIGGVRTVPGDGNCVAGGAGAGRNTATPPPPLSSTTATTTSATALTPPVKAATVRRVRRREPSRCAVSSPSGGGGSST